MNGNSRLVDKKSLDTFAKAIYGVIMSDITEIITSLDAPATV